jgi:hypothetical protein
MPRVHPDFAHHAGVTAKHLEHGAIKMPSRMFPTKTKPNAKAPLGQGGRFAALEQKLARRPGVTDPGALAASIGRKKYGPKRMAMWSAKGR